MDLSPEELIEGYVKYWIANKCIMIYSKFKADMNENGEVDITDLTTLKKSLVGLKELTPGEELVACVTGGTEPTLKNLTVMNQYLVGIIDSFD